MSLAGQPVTSTHWQDSNQQLCHPSMPGYKLSQAPHGVSETLSCLLGQQWVDEQCRVYPDVLASTACGQGLTVYINIEEPLLLTLT